MSDKEHTSLLFAELQQSMLEASRDTHAELAAARSRISELEGALKEIAEQYENQDVSHFVFRVNAAHTARLALSPKG